MRYLYTLTCLLLVTATLADEADFDFDSLSAKKALRDYNKAVAKEKKSQAQKRKTLDDEAAKAAKEIRDAFVANLKKALKKSMQAGNLDEANKIDAAIKALEKGTGPAAGSVAGSKGKKKAKKSKARIPKNAVKWNGHHYLLSDIIISHPEAKERCERAGGHLVRIENAREQEIVGRLASEGAQKFYWIDGSDRNREGDWLFSDGTRMKFFYWNSKSPDNYQQREHYIDIAHHDWRWNDTVPRGEPNIIAYHRRGFICEWDTANRGARVEDVVEEREEPQLEEPEEEPLQPFSLDDEPEEEPLEPFSLDDDPTEEEADLPPPTDPEGILDRAGLYEGRRGVWYLKRANNFATRVYERLSSSSEIRSALRAVNGRLPTEAEMNNPPSRR